MSLNRLFAVELVCRLFLNGGVLLVRLTSTLLIGLMLAIFLIYSHDAFAHASLVKAEPARRAVLSIPPKQIRLWFNEEIEADYASLVVFDEKKKTVTEKKPLVHSEDPKSIYLELPELASGKYTVKFRVLSVDGHVVDADYMFSIKRKSD
ncbi:MAG: copper resistance protein CopC [Nitrosomonas sp.]|nr:copper resistance protein CopC [Nitrosomonas sp.]